MLSVTLALPENLIDSELFGHEKGALRVLLRGSEGVARRPDGEDTLSLDEVVSGQIHRVLEMTKGKVERKKRAASLLQNNPSTLRKRVRKLDIPFGRQSKDAR
jgi:transcriptional regulator with GAF, ATPase, and Fis domain